MKVFLKYFAIPLLIATIAAVFTNKINKKLSTFAPTEQQKQ